MAGNASYPTPPWYNGVVTYVPEYCGRISPYEANTEDAPTFQITETSYWTGEVIPSIIPGLVLGGIALVGFILSLLWLCVRPCRRTYVRRRELRRRAAAERQERQERQQLEQQQAGQFISAAESGSWSQKPLEPPQQQSMGGAPPPADGTQPQQAAAGSAAQRGKCRVPGWPWCRQKWRQCRQCWPPPRQWWQRQADPGEGPVAAWTKLLLVALGVLVVAVGSWGLAQSIVATQDMIGEFWGLMDQTSTFTGDVYAAAAELSGNISALQAPLAAVTAESAALRPLLQAVGLQPVQVNAVLLSLTTYDFSQLTAASAAINNSVLPAINNSIKPALESIYDWESPTMSIQDTWRYVIIAVLFGLLILIVAATTWVTYRMRRGLLATTFVALTWLIVALLMLGGVGMMQGVETASYDACLYTETLLLTKGAAINSPTARAIVVGAMNYYFGVANLTDIAQAQLAPDTGDDVQPGLASALLAQVLGTNVTITGAIEALETANATLFVFLSDGGILAQAEAAGVDPEAVALVQELEDSVLGILLSIGVLQDLLVRTSVDQLYHRAKAYICCTVNSQAHRVWVPWTVAGSLSLVFAVLASVRVVWQTVAVPPPPSGGTRACCARWLCCGACRRQPAADLEPGAEPLAAAAAPLGSQLAADAGDGGYSSKPLQGSAAGLPSGGSNGSMAQAAAAPPADWLLPAGAGGANGNMADPLPAATSAV